MSDQPELIIKSQPIDFELSELLGVTFSDFIVLCFDGEQLEFFGTPYDTPRNREAQKGLVDRLNDRSKGSLWPEMFANWMPQICKQFKLSPETTAADYHPSVSYKISRVCHGYSQHLHAAIGLFETIAEKIEHWKVSKLTDGKSLVEITSKTGDTFSMRGDKMPLVIAEAVRALLKYQFKAQ